MTLEGSFACVLSVMMISTRPDDAGHDIPNVTSEMLTPSEAQLTWRELSAEETLTLLLLRWTLARDALVTRDVVFNGSVHISIVHINVVQVSCMSRRGE